MTLLLPDRFIRPVKEGCGFEGTQRVLWVREALNLLVLIPVPDLVKLERMPSYFQGHKEHYLDVVEKLLGTDVEFVPRPALPGIYLLDDERIRALYPPRTDQGKNEIRRDSSPLLARDRKLAFIRPLIDAFEKDPHEIFEGILFREKLAECMALYEATRKCRGKDRKAELSAQGRRNLEARVRDPFNRYLALKIGANALLTPTFRCGKPGAVRKQTPGAKTGRPPDLFEAGVWASKGYQMCSEEDQKLAGICWKMYMNGRNGKNDAYLKFCAIKWSTGTEIKDGREIPILLPKELRPSEQQFAYWGERTDGARSASELLLDPSILRKHHRSKTGSPPTSPRF